MVKERNPQQMDTATEVTTMYYDELITLVNVLDGTETQVWCGKKSVTRTEFYQSQAVGITPTCVVELWARDYANQQEVMLNNVRHSVIRSYEDQSGKVELTLQVKPWQT